MDKRAQTGYWTMQVPVLSTAHITPAIGRELSETLPGEDFYGAACMIGSHGAMLYCGELDELPESAPQCVRDVLAWAKGEGFEWVRLDEAGDTIDALPEYAW